jgi:hypothetical protein
MHKNNSLIYNPKEGNPSWELSISINFGALEYWSIGVMTKGLMSFFQHSNTPVLHYSKAETFKNFWQPLNYLFIGYNSDNRYGQKLDISQIGHIIKHRSGAQDAAFSADLESN